MTNLEWIRTLSEEEFADWLYDEWLHHLQYRWSSSRGGLIIWLKADRKTAIEMLRQEKYNIAFRDLFRDRFGKMSVKCPMFEDLESVDGVSPPR